MSVSYWGDLFYGVDRIENSEIFDKDKERQIIVKSLREIWNEEDVLEAMEEYELSYDDIVDLDLDDNLLDITTFLNNTGVVPYYCSSDVLFFGINYVLPWEVKEVVTKEEVDLKIYESLKPVLKDNITFEIFKEKLNIFVINGADDYVTYYSLD